LDDEEENKEDKAVSPEKTAQEEPDPEGQNQQNTDPE